MRTKEKFGACEQVLQYLETEYHYSEEELDFLQPMLDDFLQNLLDKSLLDPQTDEDRAAMRTEIDGFFYDSVVKSRRKKMLM
jgi:hypothetical protein